MDLIKMEKERNKTVTAVIGKYENLIFNLHSFIHGQFFTY